MTYIVELWKVPKTGKHAGKAKLYKKTEYDSEIVPKAGDILMVSNKQQTHETRYMVNKTVQAVYQVKPREYHETGTEFYLRVFIERF